MNPFRFIAKTPWPAKAFFGTFVASLAVAFVATFAHQERLGAAAGVGLGASAVLPGVNLAANIAGVADSWSETLRTTKPMGVDYSQSWLGSTSYARFFGAFMAIVGVGMTVGFLSELRSISDIGAARAHLRRSEGPLIAAASDALASGATVPVCRPAPPSLPTAPAGPFTEMCVVSYAPHGAVEFIHDMGGGRTIGLLYRSDTLSGSSTASCIRPLDAHWTEFSRPPHPNCPDGYRFPGAG